MKMKILCKRCGGRGFIQYTKPTLIYPIVDNIPESVEIKTKHCDVCLGAGEVDRQHPLAEAMDKYLPYNPEGTF